jgi:hypothetical protein
MELAGPESSFYKMIFPKSRRKPRPNYLTAAAALLLSALMMAGTSAARDSSRQRADAPVNLPFGPSEELIYEGEFTKALLRGIDIADLRFKATLVPPVGAVASNMPENQTGKSLHLTVDAVTKGILLKLFRVRFRQHIESTVDATSFSVLRTVKLDEQGDRRRTSEAVFDRTTGKVVWTERDPNNPAREPRVISSEFSGAVQDLASIFYFLRTQPLAPGQNLEIAVSDSGRVYRVPIKVVERKKMKSVLGEVMALRVEPEVFGEGRMLQGRGKVSIWFTDDARHIPVRAHISNEMGSLDIKLKKVTAGTKT